MSFSSGVKDELSRHQTLARHCQIAEIAAIISMCGGVSISEKDHYSLKIQTENVYVARKYFTLLKKAFNIEVEVSIRQGTFSKGSRTYTVAVLNHEDAIRILKAARLFNADMEIEGAVFYLGQSGDSKNMLPTGFYTRCFSWRRVPSVIRRNFIILKSYVRRFTKQFSFRRS